ncbi:Pr6Pr family membrane protein [Utexia brackfieldae]|uniref:Pr6Pr family membrane protein n=1 Tax=Utexia brackfieldae TaxID=3074108 RepID=UPI00370D0B81
MCGGPYPRIDRKTLLYSLLPPLGYGIYIVVRGQLIERYPYPFINPLRIGYPQMLLNMMILLAVFMAIALLLARIERW